jgi:hypothetical protein
MRSTRSPVSGLGGREGGKTRAWGGAGAGKGWGGVGDHRTGLGFSLMLESKPGSFGGITLGRWGRYGLELMRQARGFMFLCPNFPGEKTVLTT